MWYYTLSLLLLVATDVTAFALANNDIVCSCILSLLSICETTRSGRRWPYNLATLAHATLWTFLVWAARGYPYTCDFVSPPCYTAVPFSPLWAVLAIYLHSHLTCDLCECVDMYMETLYTRRVRNQILRNNYNAQTLLSLSSMRTRATQVSHAINRDVTLSSTSSSPRSVGHAPIEASLSA